MTKPTVLLLHFFGGSGDTWTETVAELTARGFPCLAPDLRGFGENRAADVSFAANVSDVR
ncbi:MAG: alpha/beta fold hydrolase, partial [Armatimonadetes bacterium]|nr:alpha/beta fold hydrolase [Armatimonadota bacterium]